jgi:hypothetical protein
VPTAATLARWQVLVVEELSGRVYTTMKTMVYGHEFLAVRDLSRAGGAGSMTVRRGAQVQNLDEFPPYCGLTRR